MTDRPWFCPSRDPDFQIGRADGRYLLRWHIFKSNWFSIYLHKTLRSDSEIALHDHPWHNVSIVLRGGYVEVRQQRVFSEHRLEWTRGTTSASYSWLVEKRVWCPPGTIIFRRKGTPHRLILPVRDGGIQFAWSLFICFRKSVDADGKAHWGFHCPKGWKRWDKLVKYTEDGESLPVFDCEGRTDDGRPRS